MKFSTILALAGAALAAPGGVSTSTVSVTTTSTVTTGSVSTVFTFLRGNPPSSSSSAVAVNEERATSSSIPTVVTVTSTVTELTTAQTPTTTKTFYPCATPFPSLIPTLPYGDSSLPDNFATENSIFNVASTPQGASAEACCNACFFEVPNCVQAYWYSYEGCVVSQVTNGSIAGAASGQQVSHVCPAGTFNGLSYANDTNPASRSTGNIAGPCAQTYNNL
ncbi:hypothetical protein UA08_02368 [Talaromyces atroroseus]|uniref:Apple domain-containing protein n=1 Tax=Talaromyces atroroseus TaxID=1441469 RepID=A0A225B4A7_TALAT|nr:hypothetical protein UA08_02368 [Talaromyces atroroseus]OKL62116.1 hypothetical protein UA08_02368 [Talaromyces atroroseus]